MSELNFSIDIISDKRGYQYKLQSLTHKTYYRYRCITCSKGWLYVNDGKIMNKIPAKHEGKCKANLYRKKYENKDINLNEEESSKDLELDNVIERATIVSEEEKEGETITNQQWVDCLKNQLDITPPTTQTNNYTHNLTYIISLNFW